MVGPMKRVAVFLYGVLSYALFFLTFVYALAFIGNFYIPRSMDSPARVPFWQALLTDALLLGAFAIQHSAMARPAFKRMLTKLIPEAAERSTYVLCSSLLLLALFTYWQPIGGVVWSVANPLFRLLVNFVFAIGFLIVFVSTLLINHFDLFGLRQVWLYLIERPYTHLEFRTPFFYKYVRHPLYVGWFIAFWATPTMTGAHLLFAIMTSAYMLTAIHWEESDLITVHGERYENYRKEVPKLIPSLLPYLGSESRAGKQRSAA
jgi:protein-S-isoprenylcysteine O-methyltransferase Ste14